MTIWIGEIQWMLRNGFAYLRDPILRPLALGVIAGSGYGIVRKDGVLQIPIGASRG